MSARSLITRRGQLVTVRTWTEAEDDPEGHGEPEFTAVPNATVKAIKDTRGGQTFQDPGGEDVTAACVFHVHEELAPAGQRADGEPAAQVDDADGEFWSVEVVGPDELGTRRLFCARRRAP